MFTYTCSSSSDSSWVPVDKEFVWKQSELESWSGWLEIDILRKHWRLFQRRYLDSLIYTRQARLKRAKRVKIAINN